MSRLTSTETPATLRRRLLKLIYSTSNELINQNGLSSRSRDMAAFIVLSLTKVSSLVDQTAKAWEERNYWIKSDLFYKEWAWVTTNKEDLEHALVDDAWQTIVNVTSAMLSKSNLFPKSSQFPLGEPWQGAWKELQSRQSRRDH